MKTNNKTLFTFLLAACFVLIGIGGALKTFADAPKQEAESIQCYDSKGNPNGFGSKCISGACSCLPNPCGGNQM